MTNIVFAESQSSSEYMEILECAVYESSRSQRNLMIFDLLTSPQGHQFDPGVKILLVSCSTHHPLQFDMPHYHVRKK